MLSWGGCQQGITVSSLLPSKEEWGTGEGQGPVEGHVI